LRHEIDLFDTDAMFARDAAAAADALFQDFVTRLEYALDLFRVALVEQENRMDIAVAGVEDVGDAELVLAADALDLAENVRQLSARHDAVLREVARRQAADRSKGLLATFPQQQSVRLAAGPAYFAAFVLLGDGSDALRVGIQARLQAVDFHDQHRSDVER